MRNIIFKFRQTISIYLIILALRLKAYNFCALIIWLNVQKIKKIMNFDGHIKWDKTAESGIHKKNFNVNLSKKDLNFNVKTSLDEGLKKTIGWYYEKN